MESTYDYVVTDRGGIIENKHRVHAAVIDARGKLLFAVGDPSRVTLARSAAKPAQALAISETGALRNYDFDDADIALMCASHSSEDRHIARARTMLAKVSAQESDLRCGGHPAISESVNRAWIRKDFAPSALCNNCSGKHVGMLAGALSLGVEKLDYHLPDHPMQAQVKRTFEELSGTESGAVKWGIDGCNLPAPALPLHLIGLVFAKVAAAADQSGAVGNSVPPKTESLARIYNAMTKHPEMVGGEGRFCTALMQVFEGALIGKVGADGCYGVGIRASVDTTALGAEGALGIAVKIEDGSLEILYAVVAEILAQLEIGTPQQRDALTSFHHLKRRNTMDVVTGDVKLAFRLRTVA
ncbi:hypothetical protein Q7P37_009245 [Cladosporium fusiforme]